MEKDDYPVFTSPPAVFKVNYPVCFDTIYPDAGLYLEAKGKMMLNITAAQKIVIVYFAFAHST